MDWGSSRPCAEVENPSKLLLVKLFHCLPEPLYDLVLSIVWGFVFCVIVPILQIDKWNSIEKHLQFKGVENREPFTGEYFFYACFNMLNRTGNFDRSMELHAEF